MAEIKKPSSFTETFSNKNVLITGNTGFKGTWLTMWLKHLGANVIGYSNYTHTNPSMYLDLEISFGIKQYFGDICDRKTLLQSVTNSEPDFIFHLAAQSIVSESYKNPLETIKTNSFGTATLLDVLLDLNFTGVSIILTSDKCYENDERKAGYKEMDRFGGRDPYSASKAAAEIFLSSYIRSYFRDKSNFKIGIARAGNVIGGGDWNSNRIIVDCVRSWLNNEKVIIRNPNATRPWQHVLEPLSGYLRLAQSLLTDREINGEAFNFGPSEESIYTVKDIVTKFSRYWGHKNIENHMKINHEKFLYESNLLSLNCEKAFEKLSWSPQLNIDDCLRLVADWYTQYKVDPRGLSAITYDQIKYYETRSE